MNQKYETSDEKATFLQQAGKKLARDLAEAGFKADQLVEPEVAGGPWVLRAPLHYGVLRVGWKDDEPVASFTVRPDLVLEAPSLPAFADVMQVYANYMKWIRGDPHIL